jgi:hypothetical protein
VAVSGDLFHIKDQKAYAPADNNYYRDRFMGLGVSVLAIPGNHDQPRSSYDLIKRSPYFTLVHSTPNLEDVSYTHKVIGQAGPIPVRVFGLPYRPMERFLADLVKLDQEMADLPPAFNVVLLHADAMPEPVFAHMDYLSWKDLLAYLPRAHTLMLGHIHASFPIYTGRSALGHPQFVCKPWSIGRVVRNYYTTTDFLEHKHHPHYALLEVTFADEKLNAKAEYHPLPFVPFQQAFLPETLAREIEAGGKVNSFIQDLRTQYGSVSAAFEIASPEDFIKNANIPDNIRKRLEHYLDDL